MSLDDQAVKSEGQLKDDVDVRSETDQLQVFSQRLIDHAQFKSWRAFKTGSCVEISGHESSVELLRLNDDLLDVDDMYYATEGYAFPRSRLVPEKYSGIVHNMYTENVHAGYARLIDEKDTNDRRPKFNSNLLLSVHATKHGPAEKAKHSADNEQTGILNFHDHVVAIHSPYWPVEALEWVTRPRPHGFPSKSLIKQVIRYGCDFVHVSHNTLHPDDSEWRFSFSKAELVIIRSWTRSQRIIYRTLHVINKVITTRLGKDRLGEDRTKLCSYYFKTLMFWTCEEQPSEFWHKDMLFFSVCELLHEMIKCLKQKFCANYFIPANNMMDHLIDADLFAEIEALHRTVKTVNLLDGILQVCTSNEMSSCSMVYNIDLLAWIKRAMIVYDRLSCQHDNFTDLLNSNMTKELQLASFGELSGICEGLCLQQQATSCVDVLHKEIYLFEGMMSLKVTSSLHKSTEGDMLHTRSRSIATVVLPTWFLAYAPSKTINHLKDARTEPAVHEKPEKLNENDEATEKCLLYSRSMDESLELTEKTKAWYLGGENNKEKNIGEKNNGKNIVTVIMHRAYNVMPLPDADEETATDEEFYQDWPGHSPTVNISWFIAKAYLANLYYTLQHFNMTTGQK